MSDSDSAGMPRVRTSPSDTAGESRSVVRQAIVDAVAKLARAGGVAAVTMATTAEGAGIRRATLDEHFSYSEVLLLAWREQQVSHYLAHLRGDEESGGDPLGTLRTVLDVYAVTLQQTSTAGTPAILHDSDQHRTLEEHRQAFVTDLIRGALGQGLDPISGRRVRTDLDPSQLAELALHSIDGAACAPTPEAARALAGRIFDTLTFPG
ncbi:TetR/AcrR family transcriptional regulator [Arthrobacter sp. MDT1-65]